MFQIEIMFLTMINTSLGEFGFVGKILIMKWMFWIKVSKVLIVLLSSFLVIFVGFILLSMVLIKGWIESIFGLICVL